MPEAVSLPLAQSHQRIAQYDLIALQKGDRDDLMLDSTWRMPERIEAVEDDSLMSLKFR